jgi:hypothetical protein
MYVVDERDAVVPLTGVPQSSPGVPLPLLLCDDFTCLLAYLVSKTDLKRDGTYPRVVDPESSEDPVALVQFDRAIASYLGAPNDEALGGHPLAQRGLRHYGAFEVTSSSWVRSLERMNSVHPQHKPSHFASYRHFVFAFHDTTFECVAQGFEVTLHQGSRNRILEEMRKRLG